MANKASRILGAESRRGPQQPDQPQQIMAKLEQLGQTGSRDKVLSLGKGIGQSDTSKTQGTLHEAHKASPTEEAAIEIATMAGRDKEGVQSLSMAPPG